MKKVLLAIIGWSLVVPVLAEHVEPVPFGDMEQWVVRYIPESKIIGGKTRTLYAIGPTDTIRGGIPYRYGQNGNPWSMSDAYAVVMGIHKAAGTVSPEPRQDGRGTACRMDVKMMEVVVMGFINIHVLVNGTVFWGQTIEPITTAKDPYQNIDFGVPFTKHPKYLQLDYKCIVSPEQWIWRATGMSASKKIPGHDECEAYLLLQKRWEDADGHIHAWRVGTAYERWVKDEPEWINDHRIEVHYGDITGKDFYKPYMGLDKPFRAYNSRGEIVQIEEDGWAEEGVEPTHAILMITSGSYEAFYGKDGNCLWIDNVGLVYE
ncbi:MAG: PCMD domain-containing protein [Paludibacteraceae bacterium]|nr:PCMD domain-containing protein [Paludibacteraceae bacterium]